MNQILLILSMSFINALSVGLTIQPQYLLRYFSSNLKLSPGSTYSVTPTEIMTIFARPSTIIQIPDKIRSQEPTAFHFHTREDDSVG